MKIIGQSPAPRRHPSAMRAVVTVLTARLRTRFHVSPGALFGPAVGLLLALALIVPSAHATDAPLSPGAHTARLDGVTLWYKIAGHGPVALVPAPGWGSSSDYLSLSLAPLEQQFTMVYLDTRGSGRSSLPPGDGDITSAQLNADLEALRDRLGVAKVWIIGHSEGGLQAMQYTLTHPSHVQGLILVDTFAGFDDAYRKDQMTRIQRRSHEPWFPAAMEAVKKLPATDEEFAAQSQVFLPLYFADPSRIEPHAAVFKATTLSADVFRRSLRRMAKTNLLADLPRIAVPALIVVGSDDAICSVQQAEILHRWIPRSKLLLIEDAGHFPFVEQADAFFAGVRAFLPSVGYTSAPTASSTPR